MLSGLPILNGLAGGALAAPAKRDFLKELGVRPIINGAGVYTMMTGSLMNPEAVQAIEAMSHSFVRLDELHDAVGQRIARLLGCEAAMVPSGAAAGLTLATAACMTGTNPEFILRLPDTTGMKNEVIIQRSHRFPYDHSVRNCGVRLVEVTSTEELERAITPRTAMLLFLNKNDPLGQIKTAEFIQLGKKHGIPTLNDAAADVPPVENLFKYIKMGFDLVAFSGGKGLLGPQSAGLLLGRKDLIQAARLNTAPNSDSLGRGLKVNKEEIVAMWVALEHYLKRDHKKDWRDWEERVQVMSSGLAAARGVSTERFVPEIANQVPHLRIRWDPGVVKIAHAEAMRQLREGEPSIEPVPASYVKDTLEFATWMFQPGEAEVVTRRLREILRA
jgi:L-seryl-tRNA(Ser) seleniumtransferase